MHIFSVIFVFLGMLGMLIKDSTLAGSYNAVISYVVVFSGIICMSIQILRAKIGKFEKLILLASFAVQIFLMYYDRTVDSLVNIDTEYYHQSAVQLANHTMNSARNGGVYAYLVSLIYQVFGVHRIIAQFVNVLLVTQAKLAMFELFKSHGIKKNYGIFVGLWACFSPTFLINTCVTLREALIIYLLTYAFKWFDRWLQKPDLQKLCWIGGLSLVAMSLHAGSAALPAGVIVCVALYDRKHHRMVFRPRTVSIILLAAFGVMVLNEYFGNVFFNKFQSLVDVDTLTTRMSVGRGGSGYNANVNVGNPLLNMILSTPLRMLYFLFSPMPWNWRGLTDILGFAASSMFLVFTFFFAFRALRDRRVHWSAKQLIQALLIIDLAMAVVFGWGTRNAGTAMRHREKFLLINGILFAYSLHVRKARPVLK